MADTVFLFDVDNRLLDNDGMRADLGVHLARYYGEATRDRAAGTARRCRGHPVGRPRGVPTQKGGTVGSVAGWDVRSEGGKHIH